MAGQGVPRDGLGESDLTVSRERRLPHAEKAYFPLTALCRLYASKFALRAKIAPSAMGGAPPHDTVAPNTRAPARA
jgi:hypothetical protein